MLKMFIKCYKWGKIIIVIIITVDETYIINKRNFVRPPKNNIKIEPPTYINLIFQTVLREATNKVFFSGRATKRGRG